MNFILNIAAFIAVMAVIIVPQAFPIVGIIVVLAFLLFEGFKHWLSKYRNEKEFRAKRAKIRAEIKSGELSEHEAWEKYGKDQMYEDHWLEYLYSDEK